jgi:hypothetical protein
MKTSKASAKVLALIIIVMVVIVATILHFSTNQPRETGELPTREGAIPTDAVKMMPESDFYPPILHSEQWMQPVPLCSAVNTEGNEGWPSLTQDGNELWLTRTYLGSPAIYRSLKVDGEWQEPELILSQFAGESSMDNGGNIYFTHHYYNNQSKMIEADIYVALKK